MHIDVIRRLDGNPHRLRALDRGHPHPHTLLPQGDHDALIDAAAEYQSHSASPARVAGLGAAGVLRESPRPSGLPPPPVLRERLLPKSVEAEASVDAVGGLEEPAGGVADHIREHGRVTGGDPPIEVAFVLPVRHDLGGVHRSDAPEFLDAPVAFPAKLFREFRFADNLRRESPSRRPRRSLAIACRLRSRRGSQLARSARARASTSMRAALLFGGRRVSSRPGSHRRSSPGVWIPGGGGRSRKRRPPLTRATEKTRWSALPERRDGFRLRDAGARL